MSVSGVTSQLNAMQGCGNSCDCCNKVDGINGELARLSQRINALESGSSKAQSAFDLATQALNAINPLRQDVARAIGFGDKNADDITNLLGAVAAAFAAAEQAGRVADSLKGGIFALGQEVGKLFNQNQAEANNAEAIAQEANRKADAALAAAGDAKRTAQGAAGLAQSAKEIADNSLKWARGAYDQAIEATKGAQIAVYKANIATNIANAAGALATRAIGSAADANFKAVTALSEAKYAGDRANRASISASAANSTADRAASSAGAANGKADRAASAANAANGKADRAAASAAGAASAANGAKTTADRAAAGAAGAVSTANGVKTTAERALAAALSPARAGQNGRDGRDGRDGKDGTNAVQGVITNLPGVVASLEGKINAVAQMARSIGQTRGNESVNDGDREAIIQAIQGVKTDVIALPAVLVASQGFRTAVTTAAATGACQSSKPGGCPGGSADRFNNVDKLLGGVNTGISALNNVVVNSIEKTLNVVNTKLGAQITGGLSAWMGSIANVVNNSQVLNILTYISVLHNAYFLSSGLSQTLFSAVGNILTALGIKDYSTDPAGTALDVNKVVGQWTEGFFKTVIGAETVNDIKADWKKYSRIYQAAAQVVYSLQSIGHSILGALEVVGSQVAKIGNALQKFRTVGEKAFGWMNPTPFFQNRFTNGLQQAQEIVSGIDQVASSVVSTQQSITDLTKQTEELQKSVGQAEGGKQTTPQPEAITVKTDAIAAKIASKTPDVPESAQTKS